MFFTASTIGLGYPLSSNFMFKSSPSTSEQICDSVIAGMNSILTEKKRYCGQELLLKSNVDRCLTFAVWGIDICPLRN